MSNGERSENPIYKEYVAGLYRDGLVKDPDNLTDQEKSVILEGIDDVLKTYKACCEQTDEHESS